MDVQSPYAWFFLAGVVTEGALLLAFVYLGRGADRFFALRNDAAPPRALPPEVFVARRRRKRGGVRRALRAGETVPFLSGLVEDRSLSDDERLDAALLLTGVDLRGASVLIAKLLRSRRESGYFRWRLLDLLAERPCAESIPLMLRALRSRDIYVLSAAEAGLKKLAAEPAARGEIMRRLVRVVRASRLSWRYLTPLRVLIYLARAYPQSASVPEALVVFSLVVRRQTFDTSYGRDVAALSLEAIAEEPR